MCKILIIDNNNSTLKWALDSVSSSMAGNEELFVCRNADDISTHLNSGDIDIVLAKIDETENSGAKLIKRIKMQQILTIIVGYGVRRDFNSLLKAMRSGLSHYSSSIYDSDELVMVLNDAYEQYRRRKMKLKIKFEEESNNNTGVSSKLLQQWVSDFCRNSINRNTGTINTYFYYLSDIFSKKTLLSSKAMSIELILSVSNYIENNDFCIPDLFFQIGEKEYKKMMSFESTDEILAWLRKTLLKISHILGGIDTDSNIIMLNTAMEYIKSNYQNDISRDEVAGKVNLSPSYFSQFFKIHTGESFIEYLRKIRIEKAKNLLEESNCISSKVGFSVGYNSSKYFTRVFREHTGYTPCDYRRLHYSRTSCAQ